MSPRAAALIAIALGGALGALVRAGLTEALPRDQWPLGTFIVNIAGTVLLALVAALIAWRPALPHWFHPLVAVGFCGSLTTFAGIQLEALGMMRRGMSAQAVLYVTATVVLGLIAVVATRRAAARVLR